MNNRAAATLLALTLCMSLCGCSFLEQGSSQERPEGPVPDVVGDDFEAACRILQNRAFQVAYSPTRVVEQGEAVSVVSQDPQAGEYATESERRQADVVKLILSGPPPEDAFDSEGACLRYNEITIK